MDKVSAKFNEIAGEVSRHVPPEVHEAAARASVNVQSVFQSIIGWLLQCFHSIMAMATQHGNTIATTAREKVMPVLQPYVSEGSRRFDHHFGPSVAWARSQAEPVVASWDRQFDEQAEGLSKFQVFAAASVVAVISYLIITKVMSYLCSKPKHTLAQRGTKLIKSMPGVSGMIEKQKNDTVTKIRAQISQKEVPVDPILDLPPGGLDSDSVMSELEMRACNDFRYADGESRASGVIYMAGDTHRDLLNDAYCMFSQANPLHPDMFPSVRRMEAEVVSMTASIVGGGLAGKSEVCGTMTSGGSESIVTAMFTSIAFQKDKRGINAPEIIIADSGHAAYWKAAKYANAKLIVVPVKPGTFQLTSALVRPHLTRNTAVVVASAVTYPHGIIDDITGIAALCKNRSICLHVDACLGGFVLPFLPSLGYTVPPFDFSVPGVTSMSIDTHKYGMGHKGTSVVLYASSELRRAQFMSVTEWSGGLYVSPGISGSRSGALIATAWTALRHMGRQGYQSAAKHIMDSVKQFTKCVESVPELVVCGKPVSSVVAFTSTKRSFSILALGDLMAAKGWHLATLIKPSALHFCFTEQHACVAKDLCADLLTCCGTVRELASKKVDLSEKARLYGFGDTAVDRDGVADILCLIQEEMLAA